MGAATRIPRVTESNPSVDGEPRGRQSSLYIESDHPDARKTATPVYDSRKTLVLVDQRARIQDVLEEFIKHIQVTLPSGPHVTDVHLVAPDQSRTQTSRSEILSYSKYCERPMPSGWRTQSPWALNVAAGKREPPKPAPLVRNDPGNECVVDDNDEEITAEPTTSQIRNAYIVFYSSSLTR